MLPCLFSLFLVFWIAKRKKIQVRELPYYFFSLLLGYFVGSLPTAFLLVRWKRGLDIRNAGSGNVGAMNTYDVTRSRLLGAVVLLVDLLKGILAVFLSSMLLANDFWTMGVGGIGAMLGHNYSLWLRFRGGKGLATAAGVMLVLGWIFVAVWCTIWIIIYSLSKDIHRANILASVGSPLVLLFTPERILSVASAASSSAHLVPLVLIICSLILLRHYESILLLLKTPTKWI